MYHDVSEVDNPWCVSPEEFEKQMKFLNENGYKTISLDEYSEKKGKCEDEKVIVDEKLVVITFDDGRLGVFEHALPIMQKFGFFATVYVVPEWVNGKNIPNNEKYSSFMNWNQLKGLDKKGFTIGSHTFSHKNLAKLDEIRLKSEFGLAEKTIYSKIGVNVKHFCYPYGAFSDKTMEITNKYVTSVGVKRGFGEEKSVLARQWVMNSTNLNIFSKLLTKPTISLCMIVKNEEQNIEKCLNSVKEAVDEIIIVDTGSTDGTKEIASKFTDKIYDFEWCDDFSAARNESIKHATCDWVFILDADEIIGKEEHGKLLECANVWENQAYNVLTRNYSDNSSIRHWQPSLNGAYAENFQGWFPSMKIRLWQQALNLQFEGKMHELISSSSKMNLSTLPLSVHHYGSVSSFVGKKSELYLKLAEQKIKADPQNAKAYFELGIRLKEKGKFAQAEMMYRKSLELDSSQLTPLLDLAVVLQKQDKNAEAKQQYGVILEKFESSDGHFGLGNCYLQENDFELAEKHFSEAIKLNPIFFNAYVNLAVVYEKQNKLNDGVEVLGKAIKLNQRNPIIFHNLGVIYEKMGQPEMVLKCYNQALQLNYPQKERLVKRIEGIKDFMDKNG